MNGNENLETGADDNNETEAISTAPFNCHQCRKSKLKCDRTRPCCSRCANQGYECVYSNSRQPYKSRTRGQAKEMEAKLGELSYCLIHDKPRIIAKSSDDRPPRAIATKLPNNESFIHSQRATRIRTFFCS